MAEHDDNNSRPSQLRPGRKAHKKVRNFARIVWYNSIVCIAVAALVTIFIIFLPGYYLHISHIQVVAVCVWQPIWL